MHRISLLLGLLLAWWIVGPAYAVEDLDDDLRQALRDGNFILFYDDGAISDVRMYEGAARGRAAPERPAGAPEVGSQPAELRPDARVDALRHPDPAQRAAAVDALMGSAGALDIALAVLEHEQHGDVVKSALEILAGYELPSVDPILKLAAAPQPDVRIHALEVLLSHQTKDPRIRQVLETAAASDEDVDVRQSALSLLHAIGSE
jgi:hypothetical protein